MNDPACKMRNNPRHVCADKFGQQWDRPGVGPRPGTHCHMVGVVADAVANLQAEFDDPKSATMQALGDLLASTMPEADDNDDCENAR